MTGENKWVQIDVDSVDRVTEKALLTIIDGANHWLPKSQCNPKNMLSAEGQSGKMEISRWIAGEKGLIGDSEEALEKLPKQQELAHQDDIPF